MHPLIMCPALAASPLTAQLPSNKSPSMVGAKSAVRRSRADPSDPSAPAPGGDSPAASPSPQPVSAGERLRAARAAAGPPPPSVGETISRAKAALAKAKGEALGAQKSVGVVSEKPFSVFGSHEIKPRIQVGGRCM